MTQLCAALDFPSWREAEPFARAVSPHVALFKIGLELFTAEGPAVVRAAAALGKPIFLDLKLHDIPNTVEQAMRSAVATGAAMVTVHAGGGARMIEAALRGASGKAQVLAVTVLTSMDDADLSAVGLAGPAADAVERLAKLAVGAGANGIVCSPREVAAVRAAVGAKIKLVVPGIRPVGSDRGDQARAATPEAAARAGADVIVIGRPLRDAPDPAAAAQAIAAAVGTL